MGSGILLGFAVALIGIVESIIIFRMGLGRNRKGTGMAWGAGLTSMVGAAVAYEALNPLTGVVIAALCQLLFVRSLAALRMREAARDH